MLINIGLAVAAQCEWCIAFHVEQAVKADASRDEMVEAGFMALTQSIVFKAGDPAEAVGAAELVALSIVSIALGSAISPLVIIAWSGRCQCKSKTVGLLK